ncbi:MAG: hypothetical protein A2Y62_03645 [Candidatus Fischerbacteria bacterium RBG_13_37_8]|uniref:Uncharacterized protein n=1 Tax=Candidatus Fischerbacteria bacterium RBG_13_37_8 TaxID=1817863 RepID=A0A1F5V8B7_9BACT|nr:MAG: hypothetical protein A2Y62_03645 [Candidatus Fischerbacteria bacterium RBG_13_37_8]
MRVYWQHMNKLRSLLIILNMTFLILVAYASIPTCALSQDEISPQENTVTATKESRKSILAEFKKLLQIAKQDVSYEYWSKTNSTLCESDGYPEQLCDWNPEAIWCNKCTIKMQSCRAEFMFHPDLDKGVCTLQQARIVSPFLDDAILTEAAQIIEKILGKGTLVFPNKKNKWDKLIWTWKSSNNEIEVTVWSTFAYRYDVHF